jgi:hypothetical protein
MAANDYYHQKPLPDPTYPPTGYSGAGQPASSSYSTYSGPPPSYTSQPPPKANQPSPSPFDTPFDDHVYPASTHQSPYASQNQLSQQGSDYNRLARVPSEDMAYNHHTDDIPLQPQGQGRHSPNKDPEMQDHVYEAPKRKKSRKARVRMGELGMLGSSDGKKIPWVVYLFTVIQVAVFVGELVKNGMVSSCAGDSFC